MLEKEFFKVTEIAELLQVSKITIYNLIKQKKLSPIKIGGSYFFNKQTIKEWTNSRG